MASGIKMNTFKTLIFSTQRTNLQKIKSALELLPPEIAQENRFDIFSAENHQQLKRHLSEKMMDFIVIEHNDETKAGFGALEIIQNFFKGTSDKYPTFSGVIFFVGTNEAKTAVKALHHVLVSDYIQLDELKVNTFGQMLLQTKKMKATINSEKVNMEYLMEIISFQDTLIDDLIQRIISIANQQKPVEDAEEWSEPDTFENVAEPLHLQMAEKPAPPVERFNLGEKYSVSFLDIRIFINDSLSDVYLKYEIETLFKLVYQFFNGYIEKYNIIRLHTSSKRILAAFLDEKALNCALEIIIKLAQIELSGDAVLSHFKFALGVDTGRIVYTDELENLNRNMNIKHLEFIMEKSKKNNTVYVSQRIYEALKPKIQQFFKHYDTVDNLNVYQFELSFNNSLSQ